MSSVDKRIVSMQFDNQQFESGVKTTMSTLDKLKSALKMDGATEGLNNISKSAKTMDLNSIGESVKLISERFSALGIVGMEVLRNLTNTALDLGKKLATSVIDPIVQGGIRRAQNIENAHFMLQGLLGDEEAVQAIMNDAMDSVDGTAYAYDSAAKAAAQFAATGMRSGEQMQRTLRAITGVAAMTNSEYEEISRIFTTVAGNGRLMGDQLLQLSTRGLNAPATIAKYLGTTEESVRALVSAGGVSFEMFAMAMDDAFGEHAKKANETFTGAMSNIRAALARIGADFVSPLLVQNGPLIQVLNAIRERVNDIRKATSPIAQFLTTLANTYLTKLAARIKDVEVGDAIAGSFDKLNSFITMVVRHAKRLNLVENHFVSLRNIGEALGGVFSIARKAFAAIFPGPIIDKIAVVVEKFRLLTDELLSLGKVSEGSLFQNNLLTSFKGFFSILDIGAQILKAVFRVFTSLIDPIKDVGTSVSDVTANFGTFFTELATYLRENDTIYNFLKTAVDGVVSGIETVIDYGRRFGETVESIIQKFQKAAGVADEDLFYFHIPSFKEFLGIVQSVIDKISEFKQTVVDLKDTVVTKVEDIINRIKKARGEVDPETELKLPTFDNFLNTLSDIADKLIEFGKTAGVVFKKVKDRAAPLEETFNKASEAIKKFFKSFSKENTGDAEEKISIFERLATAFESVKKFLSPIAKAMKGTVETVFTSLKNAISNFDLEDALKLGFIGVLLAWLEKVKIKIDVLKTKLNILNGNLGIVSTLNTLKGTFASFSKDIKADALKKVAVSIGIISLSLIALSGVDSKDMAVGLAGIKAILVDLVAVLLVLDHLMGVSDYDPKSMNGLTVIKESLNNFTAGMQASSFGTAVLKIAGSVLLLAVALKTLSKLSWRDLRKGLLAITVLLGEMVLAAVILQKYQGAYKTSTSGILSFAIAIRILVSSVKALSKLEWEDLKKGLKAVSILLAELVIAVRIMSKNSAGVLAAGLAMIPLAIGIRILVGAVKKLSELSWEEIGKGLTALAGALLAITVAIQFMPATLPLIGIGFLAIAAGLVILSKALSNMGGMSWGEIGKSLLVLAASLTILVVAVSLMVAAIPGAAALVIITAALALLTPILMALGSMPIEQIGKSLLTLAGTFTVLGLAAFVFQKLHLVPTLIGLAAAIALLGVGTLAAGAGMAVLAAGISAMAASGSIAVQAFVTYLQTIIVGIAELIPLVITKIGEGIVAVLQLFANSTAAFVSVFVTIGMAILTALETLIPKLIDVGMKILIALLTGIATNIQQVVVLSATIIAEFLIGLGQMMPVLINAAIYFMTMFINSLANGIRDNTPVIMGAIKNLISAIIEFILSALQEVVGLIPLVGDDLANQLEGAKEKVRNTLAPEEGEEIGKEFVRATADGINSEKGSVEEAASGMSGTAHEGLSGILHSGHGGAFGISSEGGKDYAAGWTSTEPDVQSATEGLSGISFEGLSGILGVGGGGSSFDISNEAGELYGDGFLNQAGNIDSITGGMSDNVLENFDITDESFNLGELDVGSWANALYAGEPEVDNSSFKLRTVAMDNFNMEEDATISGENTSIGLSNGMLRRLDAVREAAYQVASGALSSMNSTLAVMSPSRKTTETGEYTSLGLIRGMLSLLPQVRAAGSELGENTMDPITAAVENVKTLFDTDLDMNPTITPVLDMTNIQNGIGTMNGLFGNPSIDLFGTRGLDLVNQSVGDYTNTPSQMFNLVSQLRDDVVTLGNNMAQMQMVLDTGTFVGATTENYSQSFAINAKRVR